MQLKLKIPKASCYIESKGLPDDNAIERYKKKLLLAGILMSPPVLAFSPLSIENTSVPWSNVEKRNLLLKTIPQWSSEAISRRFDDFINPQRFNFPLWVNNQRVNYSTMYINALWGPKQNPLSTLSRPAKAFVFFFNSQGQKSYAMAPIVENKSTKKYYVFENKMSAPMQLEAWVAYKTRNRLQQTGFNICRDYATKPSDVCKDKFYQDEVYQAPSNMQNTQVLIPTRRKSFSAKRQSFEDWYTLLNAYSKPSFYYSPTVYSDSVSWHDKAQRLSRLQRIQKWPSYKKIKRTFKKIRDFRYYDDDEHQGFKRRISWLYPDDGCWVRASSIFKDFFGPKNNPIRKQPRPSKIFAFGNLCLNTNHAPTGKVKWWYHVAPIVVDAKTHQAYVLDPSVEPKKPVTINKWLSKIAANDGACADEVSSVASFNICNSYGVEPFSRCQYSEYENFESEIRPNLMQRYFLNLERERQHALGRNANKILGESPPW